MATLKEKHNTTENLKGYLVWLLHGTTHEMH